MLLLLLIHTASLVSRPVLSASRHVAVTIATDAQDRRTAANRYEIKRTAIDPRRSPKDTGSDERKKGLRRKKRWGESNEMPKMNYSSANVTVVKLITTSPAHSNQPFYGVNKIHWTLNGRVNSVYL